MIRSSVGFLLQRCKWDMEGSQAYRNIAVMEEEGDDDDEEVPRVIPPPLTPHPHTHTIHTQRNHNLIECLDNGITE